MFKMIRDGYQRRTSAYWTVKIKPVNAGYLGNSSYSFKMEPIHVPYAGFHKPE